MNLVCSICLYVRPSPDADESELDTLTIIDGQMLCVRHAPMSSSEHFRAIRLAVYFESGGKTTGLSEYQTWRAEQDNEPAPAGGAS